MSKKIEVKWTGSYPCLCSGEWILKIDGEDYSDNIPFRYSDANTYNTYYTWHFGEDWDEQWDTYDDGLQKEAWIAKHKNWLKTLPISTADYGAIYDAFNQEDFRLNSCGGCI